MSSVRFLTSDGVSLLGELRSAEGSPRGTAVLCHPHPRLGGSKDHPLLWAIRNDLAGRRGLTVLAFNFRGVRGSGGEHGSGREELRDVAAAVDRVREEADGPTVLVGWSFGASVALRHAISDPRVAAVAGLGLPLSEAAGQLPEVPHPGALERFETPVLLVAGDHDPICPVEALRAVASRLPRAWTLVVPGGDHFLARRERDVAARIGEWVDRTLGQTYGSSPGGSPSGGRRSRGGP
jgi:alpha/beta superfamily hydrolase